MISAFLENNFNFGRSDLLSKALFKRADSVSKLIPYLEWIEEKKLFVLNDLSLGVVYEFTPLSHEVMSKDEILGAVARLKPLLEFDKNYVVGISYVQDNDTGWEGSLEGSRNRYQGHETSKFLYERKLEVLRGQQLLKRSLRFWVRFFPRSLKQKKLADEPGKTLYAETKEFQANLIEFTGKLNSLESNLEMSLRRLGVNEVLGIARDYFSCPESSPVFSEYNPELSLAKQVVRSEIKTTYESITSGQSDFRAVMTGAERPRINYPGLMSYLLEVEEPFVFTMNISFPTELRVKKEFTFKTFCLERAPGSLARMMKEDLSASEEKAQRGDGIVFLTPIVTLRANSAEELAMRERKLSEVFTKKIGMGLAKEDKIGFGLGLNSLPLFHTPLADVSSERYLRVHKSDALQFLPVFSSNRGLREPLSLHRSRENNLIHFNLFENETSNHTVVLADTGSGKSAFVIDCVQSVKKLESDPLIFVIDRKSSYLMLSRFFDADLTVFDPNGDLPFSPFRGVYDNAKISFLTHLLKTAISLSSPSFEFEGEHISAVSDALKLAYLRKQEVSKIVLKNGEILMGDNPALCELSMEDIVEAMAELPAEKGERLESITQDLILKLSPFYGDGIYSKYFEPVKDGAGSFADLKTQSFFIYDLDALSSDPILQTLMTMAVVEEIRCHIKANPGRGGLLIFEEIGMLGKDNKTAESFIIEAAETFRKLGVWLIGLTPRPQNYF